MIQYPRRKAQGAGRKVKPIMSNLKIKILYSLIPCALNPEPCALSL
jgi:hypothetical protein